MMQFPLGVHCPVEHDSALPEAVDVAIVGGGVIGVMTAYFLADKGLQAVVLEKGRVAAEQSSRNWGWIRQQGRDLAELPIMTEANSLWREIAPQLDVDIGLEERGVAYLAEDDAEMAGYLDWKRDAAALGVQSETMTADQVTARWGATKRWAGALFTPSDMKAEPWVAVPALARAAVAKGAMIAENCAVRGLDLEAGRVAGVITEKGRIRAKEVVVAGGAWSSLFLRRHGIELPQLSVKALVMATGPTADNNTPASSAEGVSWRRRADGGYTLAAGGWHQLYLGPDIVRRVAKYVPQWRMASFATRISPAAPKGYPDAWGTARRWGDEAQTPFERMRVLNPEPQMAVLDKARRRFEALFPALGPVTVQAAWAGMIDATPDVVPVVDRVAAMPGLSVCTGMCGHGFGIGPGFGRVMADMVTGVDVGHDLSRFRLSRFSDGSKLQLGPAL